MPGYARDPNAAGGDRSQSEQIRRIRTRRLAHRHATDFIPLTPNEGFDATDVDCGYYLTNDGFVVFAGGLYWGTPVGYSPVGGGESHPDNDAVNLFSTTGAYGDNAWAGNLLPAEIRPVDPDRYIDCHGIEGTTGISGLIRYETRVNTGGAWTVTRVFSGGGNAYPVDADGFSHYYGVPVNQFIMLEGITWRVAD